MHARLRIEPGACEHGSRWRGGRSGSPTMAELDAAARAEDACQPLHDGAPLIRAVCLLQCCLAESRGSVPIAQQANACRGELRRCIAQDDLAPVLEIQSLRCQSRRYDRLGVRCGFDDFHARAPAVTNWTAHHARAYHERRSSTKPVNLTLSSAVWYEAVSSGQGPMTASRAAGTRARTAGQ